MSMLLGNLAAFAQRLGAPPTGPPVIPVPSAPTITIQTAATGAMIRSLGTGSASLDLGRVSYFKGTSAPGESRQKKSRSFVIATRFALTIDCPGSSPSTKVSLTMSRLDAAAAFAIFIDGTTLGPAAQTLTSSMACGAASEHRLEVEIPSTEPAGSIGSTVVFLATLTK
jgi:hypothetical protein